MKELADDPEYEIRWPPALLAAEVELLVARGRADGCDAAWHDSVETLLRQAFTSLTPQRDFQEEYDKRVGSIGDEEEPF